MTSSTDNAKNQSKRFAKIPFELWQRELSATEMKVYGVIVQFTGTGNECWLGVSNIAVEVNRSRWRVIKAIESLLQSNLIETTGERKKRKCFAPVEPRFWKPQTNVRLSQDRDSQEGVLGEQLSHNRDSQLSHNRDSQLSHNRDSQLSHNRDSHYTLNRKENIKEKRKEKPPPPENPPEWLDLGAPMYEPDGSHDISIDYNDLFNGEDNDNTNSMEATMKEDYIDDPIALNSPVSDSDEPECINAQQDPQTALVANGKHEIEPISPTEVDGVSRPTKFRYLPEHMDLAMQWAKFAVERMPTVKANVEAWANELRLIEAEITKKRLGEMYRIEPINLLKAILHFVRTDEFWGEQAISPMGLRKVSRSNSMRKFENILTSMRNSKQFKQKKSDLAFEKLKEEMLNSEQDPF